MKFGKLTESVGIGSLFVRNTQWLVSMSILNLLIYSLLIVLFCSLDSNLAEVIVMTAALTDNYAHKYAHIQNFITATRGSSEYS